MADINENMSTRAREELLRVLYNFKSDDSCILRQIQSTISSLEEDKRHNEEQKAETVSRYNEVEEDKRVLGLGAELAANFFSVYEENKDLQHYFRLLNIDLDPSEAKQIVIQEKENGNVNQAVERESISLTESLNSLDEHHNELEIKIDEAKEKYSDAEHTKNGLAALIDDVLNDNNSYNRGYVKSILEGLSQKNVEVGFTEEEIIELSQLILFPEIGLYEFDKKFKEGEINTALEIASDDVEIVEEENIVEEEPTIISEENSPVLESVSDNQGIFADAVESNDTFAENIIPIVEDYEIETSEQNIVDGDIAELSDEIVEPEPVEYNYEEESPVIEINQEDIPVEATYNETKEETLEEFLSSININIEELPMEKGKKLLESLQGVDRDLISHNLEELKIINAESKVIYMVGNDGYSYLSDPELSSKINFLREKNISESAIKYALLTNCLVPVLSEIKRKVNDIEANNESLNDANILLIKYEPKNYYANLAALRNLGIEPDEKELKYCRECFSKYETQILEDTQVLKEYGININRKNGKYELEVYWKQPRELVNNVDDIIEVGEEDLLNTTPEAIGIRTETILGRIKYCKENNIPYYDVTPGKGYEDFIYKPMLFNSQFSNPKLPEINSREMNNDTIRMIGKEQNEIISILNDSLKVYYDSFDGYKTLEIKDQEVIDLIIKLKTQLEAEIGAEVAGKNTYRLNGEYISRNKFERNLNTLISKLLESNQDIEGISKEIIFVAMLFDSRKSEESIRAIASACLGFNQENEIGGPTL